jgi:hypothetical protein
LIVIRRERAHRTKRNRHGRPSTRFDDPGHCGSKEDDAVAERKFRTVVLVLLDAVTWLIDQLLGVNARHDVNMDESVPAYPYDAPSTTPATSDGVERVRR